MQNPGKASQAKSSIKYFLNRYVSFLQRLGEMILTQKSWGYSEACLIILFRELLNFRTCISNIIHCPPGLFCFPLPSLIMHDLCFFNWEGISYLIASAKLLPSSFQHVLVCIYVLSNLSARDISQIFSHATFPTVPQSPTTLPSKVQSLLFP